MPRPYHSPSSIATGANCPLAWYYCYHAGLREADIPWADIEAGRVVANPRQRGASIGKAVHAELEAWYGFGHGGTPDWASTPGQIAAAMVPYLPDPKRCDVVLVEQPIGDVSTGLELPRPPTALVVHGVRWGGFKDLVAWPDDAEAARLGLAPGEPILIDFKTTSDLKWAKAVDVLRRDPQACVYALDVMRLAERDDVQCRWVYGQSKGRPRGHAVDFRLTRAEAEAALEGPAATAKKLDAIEVYADAVPNTRGCQAYLMPDRRRDRQPDDPPWAGGCQYHVTAGGPCAVRRSTIGFVALASKLETKRSNQPMANPPPIDPELQKAFNQLATAAKAPPAAPAPVASPPAAVASAPAPAVEAEPAPAPAPAPKRRGRPKKAAEPAPAADGLAAMLAEYQAKAAAAEAHVAELEASLAAARDELASIKAAIVGALS